jgi:transposase
MNAREERGAAIAETQTLIEKNGVWLVPSQSGNGKYHVFPDPDKPHCTCPDHTEAGFVCKHIHAVRITMTRTTKEVGMDGTVKTTTETVTVSAVKTTAERKTYRQNWPMYNLAQTNERRHFHELLADLCANIPDEPKNPKGGRPGIPMRDSMYAAVLKVYSLMSARRFNGELEEAHDAGFLSRLPHFNCVLRAFNDPQATAILKTMIETSALPLRAVEEKFAVDSTGFATTSYNRWFDHKHGTPKVYAKWVKAHFVTGCLTNVVTSVEIDHQDANDSPFLPPLTKRTAEVGFTIKEMTADCAYASNVNFAAVEGIGGTFIPMFKANATGKAGGSFEKAFHLFSLQKDEYLKRYHVRSNIESTVSMVKRKFADSVKAKNELAQKNEVYAKFVCHNVCVLIAEMYNLGIVPVLCPKTGCTETYESAPILRFPGAV